LTERNPVECLTALAGGDAEYSKISEWISDMSSPLGLYWDAAVESGEWRRFLVAFGIMVREYEKSHGLEKRSLGDLFDLGIDKIVDCGRILQAVHSAPEEYTELGELVYDFFYTIGNHLQPQVAPEILTFWPYEQSSLRLLNQLSDCLVSESVKPFASGESRILYGFLGLCGEMPVVMKLLDEKERILANQKWTCQLPEDVDVLVLAIPDPNGYLPWEDGCAEKIKALFPADLDMLTDTSVILQPVDAALPCQPGAFVLAVVYLSFLFCNDDSSDKDKITVAFTRFLLEISLYCQYDLPDDLEEDCLDFGDIRLYEWNAFCMFSVPSSAAEWLDNHLDNFDDDELAENFKIGSNSSCCYSRKAEFIDDIDFLFIRNLLIGAYKTSISGEEIESQVMTIKMFNHSADGDIPPVFQYIPAYSQG